MPCAGVGVESSLQSALERVLGKPKELVSVDLGAKLKEAGLDAFFPLPTWPPTAAVRELATRLKKQKQAGEVKPFAFAELKKYGATLCPKR